jgi:NADH dehydrogenase (ubiquinone) Fe-S protein 5
MATTQAPHWDGTKTKEVLGHLPIIETPYSRITEHWFTWQASPCADAEMDFALCAGRVGAYNTASACKQYHDDFIECAYRIKTQTRYNIMQKEREKQGRPYIQTPAPDSINTWKK